MDRPLFHASSLRQLLAVSNADGLRPVDRLVLLVLAMHCDDAGWVQLRREAICRLTGLYVGTVRDAMGRLLSLGYVSHPEKGTSLRRITIRSRPELTDAMSQIVAERQVRPI